MMTAVNSMTLLQLQQRVTSLLSVPDTRDVWVTAELMDVAVRGGHCYMELVQKDARGVSTVAKARAIIWAGTFYALNEKFRSQTGQPFASGLKVMVKVSVNYHAVFGLSLIISDVDASYTLGDLLRRRREILERLKQDGILDQNRQLDWPEVPWRVAVISAPGAAGYGDFVNQLLGNRFNLRFKVKLFQAVMQGDRAPSTIMSALEAIASDSDEWDCVVIIRGGGATSDLAAFESYDLAAKIAMFELPVVVGIGHERDVTVLDYVANMRVKTPTAAAEWLIGRGHEALGRLQTLATDIAAAVSAVTAGYSQRLAYCAGLLPVLPASVVERQRSRLAAARVALGALVGRTDAEKMRLSATASGISIATRNLMLGSSRQLDALSRLLDALSPEATLRRGFSVTRVGGRAVTSVSQLIPGAVVTTLFAEGAAESTITKINR